MYRNSGEWRLGSRKEKWLVCAQISVPSAAFEVQKILAAIGFFPINLLIDFLLVNFEIVAVKSYAFLLMKIKWPTISELYKFILPLELLIVFFFL